MKNWKDELNPEQYRVLREKDTERPYSGKYWDNEDHGLYACAACGNQLFLSLAKMDAQNGWPSFTGPVGDSHIVLGPESAEGQEVSCSDCGGHLGYMVPGEKKPYFKVNSASLNFIAAPEIELPEEKEEGEKTDADRAADKAKELSSFFSPQAVFALGVATLLGAAVAGASTAAMCTAPTTLPIIASSTPTQAVTTSVQSFTVTTKPTTSAATKATTTQGTSTSPVATPAQSAATATPASDGTAP